MFERFTDRARRVVVLSQEEARLLNHNYIGTEHLLLGLLHESEGIAADVLTGMGLEWERVREAVRRRIGEGGGAPVGHIPFTPRAKTVLELSLREALGLGNNYIGTEHVLLGLLREGQGVAAETLTEFGVDLSSVRQEVIRRMSQGPGTGQSEGKKAPTCPGCWQPLEGRARTSVLTVEAEGGAPEEERQVRVVYCRSCGRTLGVLPE